MIPNRRIAAAAVFSALAFGASLALPTSLAGAHGGDHPAPTPAPAPAAADELAAWNPRVSCEVGR